MRYQTYLYIIIIFLSLHNTLYAKYEDIVDSEDLKCLKEVDQNIIRGKYTDALIKANLCNDHAIKLLSQWLIINKDDYFSLDSLLNFQKIANNIPAPYNLQERFYNAARDSDVNSEDISKLFDNNTYSLEVVEKFIRLNRYNNNISPQEEKKLIQQSWIKGNHSFKDLKTFVEIYKNFLTEEDLISKSNQLLSQGDIKNANYLASHIRNQDYKKYIKTVLSFHSKSRTSLSLLKTLPQQYENDETLIYYISLYYHSKNQDSKVTGYLLNLPEQLQSPNRLTLIKIRNARYHIEKGNYETAYKLLQNHNIKAGSSDFADIEWLSGWIALRFLNKPEAAIKHFSDMYNNVGYAISLSRASYWLGRSYKAFGDIISASKWFKISSGYSTTYYGQMALMEDTQGFQISLPKLETYSNSELKIRIDNNIALRLSIYLQYLGYSNEAYSFAKYVIENNIINQNLFLYLAIYKKTDDHRFITKVSRFATRKNIITTSNYPVIEDIDFKNKALAFAIIKQESGFNDKAISSKGAIGFMQLMPETAKDVSKMLNLKYSYNRLKNDQEYNLELGSYYINHLLNQFDNSFILAVAAYNAGPANVKKWINRNGDVRQFKNIYEIIDWVEKIPYPETRNYVQRILENMIIYLHLLEQ